MNLNRRNFLFGSAAAMTLAGCAANAAENIPTARTGIRIAIWSTTIAMGCLHTGR